MLEYNVEIQNNISSICIIEYNVDENIRSIVKENTISNICTIEYNVDKNT